MPLSERLGLVEYARNKGLAKEVKDQGEQEKLAANKDIVGHEAASAKLKVTIAKEHENKYSAIAKRKKIS